jgi:predicted deacylase
MLAMLSSLELRHIIESGFLPLCCKCDLNSDGSLKIQIFDKNTGRVDLLVAGVSASTLNGSRAISQLIAELRAELNLVQMGRVEADVKQAG